MQSKLNLASRIYVNRQALYLSYAVLTAVLLLILVVQVRYLLLMSHQQQLLGQRSDELRQQLGISAAATSGPTEEEFNQLLGQIAFSNKLIARDSFQWTGLLGQLEEVLPADVRISDIRPDFQQSTLDITAQARTVADLRSFIDRLNESSSFSEVLLLSQAEQPVADKSGPEAALIVFTLKVKGGLQ